MAKCKNCKGLIDWIDEDGIFSGKFCPKKNDFPDTDMERSCNYYKTMSQANRIRSMTDEELAEFLLKFDICPMCNHNTDDFCSTANCNEIGITEKWLQSPVEV